MLGQAKSKFEDLTSASSEQEKSGKTKSQEMQLLKSISQRAELLKTRPAAGAKIPHDVLPDWLNVSNLFKINLSGHYRMLYTLETKPGEIGIFVLFIVSHPEYDRIFGYRKR